MKYCVNCGKLLDENLSKCPACGGNVADAEKYLHDYTALMFILSMIFPTFGLYAFIRLKKSRKSNSTVYGYGALLGTLAYTLLGVLSAVI